MADISLGVRLPNSGPFATAENILSLATFAEDLGYDTVWVHDHISWPQHELTHFAAGSIEACQGQEPNFFESLSTLAVLGGRTRRVRLGIAGFVLPLRDPRVLAKQATAIDQLTGGRLLLAFGIGAKEHDFEVMGVRFDRRGRLTTDHLQALRAIFGEQQPTSFESKSLSFSEGTFYPRPRHLPLWVTGASDAAFERAVKYADGWMTVYAPVEDYAKSIAALRAAADAEGREFSSIDTGIETFVTVGRTHEDAVKIAKASLIDKFKTVERGMAACIVGDIDEVLEKVDRYRAAGAKHAELKFICHDTDSMRTMMEEVAKKAKVAV